MSAPASSANPAPVAKPAAATPTAAPLMRAPPAPIGLTSSGTAVYASFQPTVASLALALTPALSDMTLDLTPVLPLPAGLELMRSPEGRQLQLQVSAFFASKLRRIYGYVAEIVLTSGEGAETPAQLQLVTRIPFRYGRTTAEKEFSWIPVRLQAFVSKALFERPARALKLGMCISGFAEPSSGTARSCQVVGWDVCSLDDWRAASPASAPTVFDLAVNRAICSFLALFPHLKYGQCVRNTTAERQQFCVHETSSRVAWRLLFWPDWGHVCDAVKPLG